MEPRPQVVAGGARIVRDERDAVPAPVEGGDQLTSTGIQDVPVPDAPVQIEDECGDVGERGERVAGRQQSYSLAGARRNSSIASA
jgi:hypothetical protein